MPPRPCATRWPRSRRWSPPSSSTGCTGCAAPPAAPRRAPACPRACPGPASAPACSRCWRSWPGRTGWASGPSAGWPLTCSACRSPRAWSASWSGPRPTRWPGPSKRPAQRNAPLRPYCRHPRPRDAPARPHRPDAGGGPSVDDHRRRPVRLARHHRPLEAAVRGRGVDALLGRPHGAPARWSDEVEAILRQALEHSPDELGYRAVNWTVFLLRDHIEQRWGQRPSDQLVRQHLLRLGYVWKRPRHALPETKSPRALRRLRAIRKRVRNLPPGCAKLFEDETDLHLFPPLRAGWFLRGKPATVPITGENAKRTVFGTINVETGERVCVARDGGCAEDFQALLRLIRQENGGRKVAVLLDGASRHTAQESEGLAGELDCGGGARRRSAPTSSTSRSTPRRTASSSTFSACPRRRPSGKPAFSPGGSGSSGKFGP